MADSTSTQPKEPSFSDVLKSMKRAPNGKGFHALGNDGVVRSMNADYEILDAKGLSPRQIKQFLDGGPYSPENEKQWRGVDGRTVSEEGLYHPDPSILPKKPTPEEKAARRKAIEEQHRQVREAGGPVCFPGPMSNHDLGIDEEDRKDGQA